MYFVFFIWLDVTTTWLLIAAVDKTWFSSFFPFTISFFLRILMNLEETTDVGAPIYVG